MRTHLSRLLFTMLMGGALLASAGRSYADDHRDDRKSREHHDERREERRDERRDERREEPAEDRREVVRDHRHPYGAPPPVRVERHAERRGYVWVNGGYDWRDGRY